MGVCFLAIICAVVSCSASPVADVPYIEIVPDRYTFEGQSPVFGWGVVPSQCCVSQAVTIPRDDGTLLLMDSGKLLLAQRLGYTRTFTPVTVRGGGVPAHSRLLLSVDGLPARIATPAGLFYVNCTFPSEQNVNKKQPNCDADPTVAAAFGRVNAVHTAAGGAAFVAAENGLFRCSKKRCTRLLGSDTTEAPMTALAVHNRDGSGVIAAGSADKIWLLTGDGAVIRWEWVTVISGPNLGAGGVLDGPVTALAFDNTSGDLYAGNDIALNIRSAKNRSWGRISGDAGLPYANITALLPAIVDPVSGATQRWIGTQMGLMMHSTDPAADPPWRYFYGPRWHPGRRVTAMAAVRTSSPTVAADLHRSASALTVFAATDGGVVWFEQQQWTLARKAAMMQTKLVRHDRHALVAGCGLPSFGNTSTTLCTDDDNNGLWTSLVAASEYFRYAVTKDPAAAASARHFLGGMSLLHDVTGIPGLYARSACAPEDVNCAPDRKTKRQSCDGDVVPGCCESPGQKACGVQWR